MPKRYNNLFEQICTLDNLQIADKKAQKGKHNCGITKHRKHEEQDLLELLENLKNQAYKTSEYSTFKIYEPKERVIYRLPFYPDRILHHAIMNVMEDIWVKVFIENTYSCIKGRGIHKLVKDLTKVLKENPNKTTYCLKLDIRKFYPSIDHDILKIILRKKIKDRKLLNLLDSIIDSAQGVPIGNYLSQFFANLYLAYFDHWLKEEVKCKYYFRYADDIVILSDSKDFLRKVMILIKIYLKHVLNLQIKPNYQIYPVDIRGIDFVGYKFYHTHVLLRKSIKIRIHRLLNRYNKNNIDRNQLCKKLTSYFGWLKHCNSKNLLSSIQNDVGLHYSNWNGRESKISRFYNKNLCIIEVIEYSSYFKVHFIYRNHSYSVKSKDRTLFNELIKYRTSINYKIWK